MSTALDALVESYKVLQSDISMMFSRKQQFLSQFNENTLVKGELDLLTEDSDVFKLVGPVLMKVDLEESKGNVAKRLEFIEGEITKIDNQIADKQGEQTVIGEQIQKVQAEMRAEAATAARQVVADAS